MGNRSIFAPAGTREIKDTLNRIKGREFYRPVAPICLEEGAKEIFDPRTPDPYMLFDHVVRDGWADRIPAIVHIDGTARLQTVNKQQNAVVHELLSEYKKLTGIPLLCNTSANFPGCGFFPDVKSATEWGGTKYFWSAGRLFTKS